MNRSTKKNIQREKDVRKNVNENDRENDHDDGAAADDFDGDDKGKDGGMISTMQFPLAVMIIF